MKKKRKKKLFKKQKVQWHTLQEASLNNIFYFQNKYKRMTTFFIAMCQTIETYHNL